MNKDTPVSKYETCQNAYIFNKDIGWIVSPETDPKKARIYFKEHKKEMLKICSSCGFFKECPKETKGNLIKVLSQ